jgi:cytochrome c5
MTRQSLLWPGACVFVVLFAPLRVSFAADIGQTVYEANCRFCHDLGMGGAPKRSDAAYWQEKLSDGGIGALEDNAINGLQGYSGTMPPRGGNPGLTDEQVKAAVQYLIGEPE